MNLPGRCCIPVSSDRYKFSVHISLRFKMNLIFLVFFFFCQYVGEGGKGELHTSNNMCWMCLQYILWQYVWCVPEQCRIQSKYKNAEVSVVGDGSIEGSTWEGPVLPLTTSEEVTRLLHWILTQHCQSGIAAKVWMPHVKSEVSALLRPLAVFEWRRSTMSYSWRTRGR
jgi:hypothetical protein